MTCSTRGPLCPDKAPPTQSHAHSPLRRGLLSLTVGSPWREQGGGRAHGEVLKHIFSLSAPSVILEERSEKERREHLDGLHLQPEVTAPSFLH